MAAQSSKDNLVGTIAKAVLSGQWQSGMKLPSERELAATHGLSKTVVHSALSELVSAGLLYVQPQSGTYVADYMLSGGIETLNAIVKYGGEQLGPGLIEAVLDLRLAIEGTAFFYLGDCATASGCRRLRDMADAAAQADRSDLSNLAELFFLWYREVCAQSGRQILLLFMNTLHSLSVAFWERCFRAYGIDKSISRLYSFTELIEQHNGEGAYRLLKQGIDDYLSSVNK